MLQAKQTRTGSLLLISKTLLDFQKKRKKRIRYFYQTFLIARNPTIRNRWRLSSVTQLDLYFHHLKCGNGQNDERREKCHQNMKRLMETTRQGKKEPKRRSNGFHLHYSVRSTGKKEDVGALDVDGYTRAGTWPSSHYVILAGRKASGLDLCIIDLAILCLFLTPAAHQLDCYSVSISTNIQTQLRARFLPRG